MTSEAEATAMERRSGIALWRQIADRMRQGIAAGTLGEDGRLPPELALSERFGVNRHTVRSAIASLCQEGVLRAEQGRGTFVERRDRLSYPIARRTRFSAGLEGQARERRSRLLDQAVEPAAQAVAQALGLDEGAPVLRLETVSEADGRPVSRATAWLDAEPLRGLRRGLRREPVYHGGARSVRGCRLSAPLDAGARAARRRD